MFAAAHAGRKIRVGIVGVGNCASSLVQGLTYYSGLRSNTPVPGVMSPRLGAYHIDDVEISSAFDVTGLEGAVLRLLMEGAGAVVPRAAIFACLYGGRAINRLTQSTIGGSLATPNLLACWWSSFFRILYPSTAASSFV